MPATRTRRQTLGVEDDSSSTPERHTRSRTPSRKAAASKADSENEAAPVRASSRTRKGAPNKNAADEYENIFLFYPNLIGYSRIILAVASLYYMPLHPRTCSLLYTISCLLDALDGIAARYFSQSTRFGAVLDMVTDRSTTACLLVFLSGAFPRWSLVFQVLIALDLSSHYMHMYATLVMGNDDSGSHKKVDKARSRILNLYYSNKNFLFVICALNEVFFIALYLLSFSSPFLSPSLLFTSADADYVDASTLKPGSPAHPPAASLFANPYSAGALELARANKMDSTVPWIVAGIACPVMLFKQFVNVVQMVKASRWLAEGDRAARRQAGLGPRGTKSA